MKIDLTALRGKRVCVAVSGGGDSVALLHCLAAQAAEEDIVLSAVNVEHGIRGESSRADTEFVRALCARLGLPLYCFSVDVPALARTAGEGVEEAARKARYRIFLDLLRRDKADVIATAHHAGDNAESVLFNLFRGASLTGAGGIRSFVPAESLAYLFPSEESGPALAGKGIARPLLGVSKREILRYLYENSLEWREDESNADAAYSRNFLRREILAPARGRFPALDRALYDFSRAAREDDEYLYGLARACLEEGEVCFVSEDAPGPLFGRACVLALRSLGVREDYSARNIADLRALAKGENGGAVHLPGGIVARREYGRISFSRPAPSQVSREVPFGEGEFAFCNYVVQVFRTDEPAFGEKGTLFLDADKLPAGAVFRLRREGDVFEKFGGGRKKLKEFFIDRKIPQRVRGSLPVLACGQEIFAVCGAEISEKVRIDKNTKNIFAIKLAEKGESYKCIRT